MRRILVFEPDSALRMLLVNHLRAGGEATDMAADLMEAIDRLDHGPGYDLIVVGDPEPPSTACQLLEALGPDRLAGKRILALSVVTEDEVRMVAPEGAKVAVARKPRQGALMNAILRGILPAA